MDRNRIIGKLAKAAVKADGQRTTYQVAKELGRGGNGVAFVVKSAARELVAKFYIPPDGRDLDDSAVKRFQREIELTSKMNHPYVLASSGVGTAQIGSYQIPFYFMSRASKTLRGLVPRTFYPGNLGGMRLFTRIAQGVSYLHHRGVVHRDLKPENILIFQDVPKISDLGIAHISPEFSDESVLTLPKDQLMNRDYYAPEQRYGDATKVDHRADVYALGCILYELISGISPTRPNLPRLESFDKRLALVDRIFDRMTAHDLRKRYQHLDEALDELVWALIQIGTPGGAASIAEDDEKSLLKLLRSTNGVHQEQAMEPALRLGERALPLLHEELGNRRLDVVSAAYRILGELRHEASLPFLISGLHPRRTSSRPRFPTGEPAAKAIRRYEAGVRLEVLDTIKEVVRAEDIGIVIEGLDPHTTYGRVLNLYQGKRFFNDFGIDPGLSLLLKIDAERAWPIVEGIMARDRGFYTFSVFKQIFPFVDTQRRQNLIDHFLSRPSSLRDWDLRTIADQLTDGELPDQYVSATLERLARLAPASIKRRQERREFERYLRAARSSWQTRRNSLPRVEAGSHPSRTRDGSDSAPQVP